MTEQKDYYTIKETAIMLGVTQQKVFNLLRSEPPTFPDATRIGWQWAIPRENIETYQKSIEITT
jgi:hypothetical protein